MTQRIQAAKAYSTPLFFTGRLHFNVTDTKTGAVICAHDFPDVEGKWPGREAYIADQRRVAVALAETLNAAGDEVIAGLVETKRHVHETYFPPKTDV